MATQAPMTGSTTIAPNVSNIRIKTEHGTITHKYHSEDTILRLKQAIETEYGHPVGNQKLSYSGGVPGDPVEQVKNARFVREFAGRQGVLRLQVDTSRSTLPVLQQGSNTIGDVQSTNSTVRAGNTFSEDALRVIAETTKQIPIAKNEIRSVKADSKSVVRAGDTFGSVPASGNDRAAD